MKRQGRRCSVVGFLALSVLLSGGVPALPVRSAAAPPSSQDALGNSIKKRSERLQVKALAGKRKDEGSQEIRLTLTIDEGWFVYANPVGHKDLEHAALAVTVQTKVKPARVNVRYPAGKVVKDPVVGNWSKYEGTMVVPITVWRARGDRGPLELRVRFTLRSANECGPPLYKTVTIP
jgi:hypothetical protein